MPNWCNNNVRLTHEDPAKLEEIVQVIKKSEATNEYGDTTHYGLIFQDFFLVVVEKSYFLAS